VAERTVREIALRIVVMLTTEIHEVCGCA
jgi:hypothetical protein